MSSSRLSPPWWHVDLDRLALAVIAFTACIAPAFTSDEVFFNYQNNVEGARPLYFFLGYVLVIPELIAYVLTPLPFVAQAVLYRVAPLIAIVILYREIRGAFTLAGGAAEATLLALAATLLLGRIEPSLLATLSHTQWTALVAAALYLLRIRCGASRYSAVGLAGVLISGLAFPLGALLVVLLVASAAADRERVRRQQSAVLAVAIVAGQLLLTRGAPDQMWNPDFWQAPALFVEAFRERKLANLIAVGSVAMLIAVTLQLAIERRRLAGPAAPLVIAAGMLYFGLASVIAYVASVRFVEHEAGFEARYLVPAAGAALVAAGCAIQSRRDPNLRWLLIGVFVGIAAAASLANLYSNARGPMEYALMQYHFLARSEAARATCRPGEAFVFEDHDTSPVVLCRPLSPPPERDFIPTGYYPWVGELADRDSDDRPFILAPKRPF